MSEKVIPCIWFNKNAKEAVEFYTNLFEESKIGKINYYPENTPGPAGEVLYIYFEIKESKFCGINGMGEFTPTAANSYIITCRDQAEVDKYWNELSKGGTEMDCGWITDKYGITWQIVPQGLDEALENPDKDKANRAMQVMLKMKKLVIADIQNA